MENNGLVGAKWYIGHNLQYNPLGPASVSNIIAELRGQVKHEGPPIASFPGLRGEGEGKAWYALFAHAR